MSATRQPSSRSPIEPNDTQPSPGFFPYTRAGFNKGVRSGAHNDYIWIVKATGTLGGGLGGWQVGKKMIDRASASGALAFLRVPVATVGFVVCAGLGKEIAVPAATAGIKAGKTLRWTLEGMQYDIFGRDDRTQPSWEKRRSKFSQLSDRAIEKARGLDSQPLPTQSNGPPPVLMETRRQLEQLKNNIPAAAESAADSAAASVEKVAEPINKGLEELKAAAGPIGDDLQAKRKELVRKGEVLARSAQDLAGLRREKRALKDELSVISSKEGKREVSAKLAVVDQEMKELKAAVSNQYKVKLAKIIDKDISDTVEELKRLRVREKWLRGLLKDKRGNDADIQDELLYIREQKGELKERASDTHGVRISKLA